MCSVPGRMNLLRDLENESPHLFKEKKEVHSESVECEGRAKCPIQGLLLFPGMSDMWTEPQLINTYRHHKQEINYCCGDVVGSLFFATKVNNIPTRVHMP